ncbi:MAG: hypothetical protein RLZZ70_507 [Candidatus Parcubacteria bacterium]|jgi:hypothetical protein
MENTPRNIVLQLGALITLYLSVSFLLTLVFGLINVYYPDAAEDYWQIETATDNIRLGIAMLVVFFPTYLVLTRYVNKFRREEKHPQYQHFTKWLMYLSLLVGGLVLLGTLVTVLHTFLNGELTSRFLFKCGFVVLVVGAAFHYYLLDAKGTWMTKEHQSILYGIGVSIVVFGLVAFGLTKIETPSQVREMRLDAIQLTDLQNIQWEIIAHLNSSSSTLPATLDEINTQNYSIPKAPTEREAYSYETTANGFKLCATFAHDSMNDEFSLPKFEDPSSPLIRAEDWRYKAGRHCFERELRKS